MGKPTGLVKRGGVYQLRLRFPPDVVQKLGRTEFNRSLRTGLYADAIKRLPEARAEFDALVLATRRPSGVQRTVPMPTWPDHASSLTEGLALLLAREHFRSELRELDREPLPPRSSGKWQLYVESVEADLAFLAEGDPSIGRATESAAIALLQEHQLNAEPTSPEGQLLRAYLRRSMIQIGRWRHARLHGNYLDALDDRLFADERSVPAPSPSKPLNKPATPGRQGVRLDKEIIDLWSAERKPKQRTIDAHRAVARWFYERTGEKSVDEITRQDVLAFKTKLLEEGQKPANIKTKLSRLRTLLQWAADNDFTSANVASGVRIKAAKSDRKPFDLNSLNAIFASPVYSRGERPPQGRGEAAYWLPLLALFTGARMEELGQLRPSDVREISYPDPQGHERSSWFIRIIELEDDPDPTNLKNPESERLVAVHPELERLGFIGFAQKMQKEKQRRLFHKLTPGPYGNFTHKWGQWFGAYLRNTCGVTDKRLTFHSLRHTFTDHARRPDIPESLQRRFVGHSTKDVHDQYGTGYALYWAVDGIKRYNVPGLKLPDPPDESLAA